MNSLAIILVVASFLTGGVDRRSPVPDKPLPIDVRITLDNTIVRVGDTLRVDVDILADLANRDDAFNLARALRAATAPGVTGPARLAADSGVQSRTGHRIGEHSLFRFGRTFSYVITGTGPVDLAAFTFRWREQTVASAPNTALGAPPLSMSDRPDRAVLPLRAEIRAAGGLIRLRRSGTAFLVAEHAVITSYHVVMDAHRIEIRLPSGSTVELDRGWVLDPARDLALLWIDPARVRDEAIRPIPMASARSGPDVTYTLGYRAGWPEQTLGIPTGSTAGAPGSTWVTTNPVRPGDSGGPLLRPDGTALGVITSGTAMVPRTEVLRQEIAVATDPRPILDALVRGQSPERLEDLRRRTSPEKIPHRDVLHAGFDLSLARMRGLPAPDRALDVLGRNHRSYPGDPHLQTTIGVIARLADQDSLAEAAFQQALKLDAGKADAAYMLGLDRLANNRYADAASYFDQTASSGLYRVLGLYGGARSRIGLHELDEAELLLQAVTQYDYRFAPALFDLGRIRVARGDVEGARLLVGRLVEIDAYWGRRLERVIENPVFAPAPLTEMPRLPLPPGPWSSEAHSE